MRSLMCFAMHADHDAQKALKILHAHAQAPVNKTHASATAHAVNAAIAPARSSRSHQTAGGDTTLLHAVCMKSSLTYMYRQPCASHEPVLYSDDAA